MAETLADRYWLANRVKQKPMKAPWTWFKGCIFQHIWREECLSYTLSGLANGISYRMQHVMYLTRLLLDQLLNHRNDKALECLVGLCGACRRIPELFWRTGCEVMRNRPGSFAHVNQLIKNMFVICVPFKTEMLLDLAMYLVKHNLDITEAQELLTSKLSQESFLSSPLLRAYSGLFAHLSWKKCKLHFDKKDLDGEEFNVTDANLKRQMDFHGKKALVLFGNLVEHCGVWDIFVTRQVEILKYYDRSDEAKRILMRYKQKNPENPNTYRYLYYFLKSENANKKELCDILEGLLSVDPTSELSEEYVKLASLKTDESKGLLDTLGALFIKLDHAACRQNLTAWETLAVTLKEFCTTHGKKNLSVLWDERADWWPQFHFRLDLMPNKNNVSAQEWQLTRHKAEAARWLLGKGNHFTKAVRKQESNDSEVESSSCQSDTASPRKRKATTFSSKSLSTRNRKNKAVTKMRETVS
ncbi:LOW QUALITY PROTEIN: TATA box-binding protein-associated factor RNA polymerase I subunit A-like [Oculina patagonica]